MGLAGGRVWCGGVWKGVSGWMGGNLSGWMGSYLGGFSKMVGRP